MPLATVGFLIRFAHEALPSMFVLYTDYRYGWSARTVGLVLAGIGLSQMIVSGALVGPIVARLGERWTVVLGLMSGALGFVIYGAATTGMAFVAGLPLVALWGASGPALQALITPLVGPSEQGRLQGAQSSLNSIADMVGPPVFTQVFALAIATTSREHLPGAPYFVASGVLVAALAVVLRSTRPIAAAEAE
jgi:DHA1 family tetracycline resistance protein-like MFS transporter